MPSIIENNWDQIVAAHPAGTILQTSLWGRLKAEFGWSWEIIDQTPSTTVNGGALILYKSLPLKMGSIAYVPRGPLVNWGNVEEIEATLLAIETAARRKRAWAVWIEPEIPKKFNASETLLKNGYKHSARTIQPPSTIVIDISGDEDEILARMKSKTRYNIRLAERKGVTVREGGLDDLDTFYTLMQETGERDNFGIHTKRYYQRLLELFTPVGQAGLIFAMVGDKPSAALLLLALGHSAWYIAGASSNQYRQLMPTYAAQWAAIHWAKAQGCLTYDLWGVPDAEEDILEAQFSERSDGLWGVYRFKRGFGGKLVRYTGLWEKALHPLYRLGTLLYNAINT